MWMTFCEFATVHPDGSLTMVRGGLSDWYRQEFPATVDVWVAAQVLAHDLDSGEHPILFTIVNQAGEPTLVTQALLRLTNNSVPCNFAFPALISLPSPGAYHAHLQVGSLVTNSLVTRWPFDVFRKNV
jgi:hypothetical protein